ncbi:GH23623 [Drosophila grimshawi]|uniref:GH23623 n=1 Tax=Drosophila grimshawi TaxID=7222 RepID=B4K400_DROGR|nr:GH23623 [Drosophila grimshawi]
MLPFRFLLLLLLLFLLLLILDDSKGHHVDNTTATYVVAQQQGCAAWSRLNSMQSITAKRLKPNNCIVLLETVFFWLAARLLIA